MSDPKLRNFHEAKWDEELIEFFCGDSLIFPELTDNVCRIEGLDLGIGKEIPWIAGGLDQSVTLIGQGCNGPATGTASLSPAVPGDHRPGY